MVNITNYKINANQSYNEVSSHMGQNGHDQKYTNRRQSEDGRGIGRGNYFLSHIFIKISFEF